MMLATINAWISSALERARLAAVPLPLHADHSTVVDDGDVEDQRDPATALAVVEGPAMPDLRVNADGWLEGARVERIPSARSQRLATRGGTPAGIVWHYTATTSATDEGPRSLARRIAATPREGQRATSWHLIIGRSGLIVQSVSLLRGAWHAGGETALRLRWVDVRSVDRDWEAVEAPGSRASANAIMIGVELENAGEVRRVGGRWESWPFGRDGRRGQVIPDAQVVAHGTRWYQAYTEAQVDAAAALVRAVREAYVPTRGDCRWTHAELDPGRKSDPGPDWLARLSAVLDRGGY